MSKAASAFSRARRCTSERAASPRFGVSSSIGRQQGIGRAAGLLEQSEAARRGGGEDELGAIGHDKPACRNGPVWTSVVRFAMARQKPPPPSGGGSPRLIQDNPRLPSPPPRRRNRRRSCSSLMRAPARATLPSSRRSGGVRRLDRLDDRRRRAHGIARLPAAVAANWRSRAPAVSCSRRCVFCASLAERPAQSVRKGPGSTKQDLDAERRELLGERFRQALDGEFRGVVEAHRREGAQAADRGDVDDGAASAALRMPGSTARVIWVRPQTLISNMLRTSAISLSSKEPK